MKSLIKSAVLAGLLASSTLAAAQVVVPYSDTGPVDGVDLGNRELIIDDTVYRVAYDVEVYSSGGASIPVSRLQTGQQVGYNTTPGSPRTIVTGIWVLRSAP